MKSLLHLYLLVSILYCLGSCTQAQMGNSTEEPISSRPNIVIIFTDDQGYQDVGVFGSEISTPNIDKMAEEGVKFTNFYVAQAVCSASRAALLTGSYSNRVGIHAALDHKSNFGLNPDEVTIADMLRDNGYKTSLVGKWHLGHLEEFLPDKQGFDEFYGLPYSNDMWPFHPESPDYYPPLPLYENGAVIDTFTDQSMLTTLYTEKAVDFIQRNKENPFFLYFAHSMPHVPLFVSDKFKGKSEAGLYGDVIMEIDWSVGEVMKTLRENGLEDNTFVIFTSDNGPWLSYGHHSGSALPLREGKGTSWEGGIRVPTVMRWPGVIPAGVEQSQPAMTIDLLPTLVELTGGKLPENKIDGKNIWPLIAMQEGAVSPQEAYFIYYNRNELQAVLMGDWKLYLPHVYRTIPDEAEKRDDGIPVAYTYHTLENPELYHLKEDIGETKNVIKDHPEIAEKMLLLADQAREDMGDALVNIEGKNLRTRGELAN